MRSFLLALLVIPTSCDTRPGDGTAGVRAPVPDARLVVANLDAAVAAVPPVDAGAPPLPADPVTEKQAVAELDALGDELCACPDLDCAFALDTRMAALQQRFAGNKDSKPVRAAAERFAERARECMARLKAESGGESAPVLAMQKVADAVCACTDLACAKAEMKRAEATLAKYDKVKGPAADQEKILAHFQRMAQCRNNLTPPD